jgi:hypothetical protein
MSECNGDSAIPSVRFRRLQERSAKRLATISRVERLRFSEGDEEAA